MSTPDVIAEPTTKGWSRAQVWRMPILLTLTSSAALVVGLLADGAADVIACAGLGFPVLVAAWHTLRAARTRRE